VILYINCSWWTQCYPWSLVGCYPSSNHSTCHILFITLF